MNDDWEKNPRLTLQMRRIIEDIIQADPNHEPNPPIPLIMEEHGLNEEDAELAVATAKQVYARRWS